jgi:hypothetical protein
MAREHEVVDDERRLTRRKQLGELDVAGRAVRSRAPEDVVLGHDTARWKGAACRGDGFHRAPQFDLLGEQPVTRGAVLGRLSGKCDAHGGGLLLVATVL